MTEDGQKVGYDPGHSENSNSVEQYHCGSKKDRRLGEAWQ